ncbi:uncharacterized protein [Arachis hypogaea]|uniref:Uncharacterized protein n=1 Tax=Arachis hypogaea TaxID=3818 RepID=A0A445DJ95_ARAHY|nr:hypothetical protein Ahy_A04g021051 [Arachis hypogaea]
MTKMDKFTVVETELYLIAYEDMLNRFKKPSQPIHLANLSQSSIPSDQNFQRNYNPSRGRGRGGRFMRGGRFTNSSRLFSQICNRPGHAAWSYYYRFDQQFQSPNTTFSAQSYHPPAPPPSFHQPRAFLAAPPSSSSSQNTAWYPNSGASHHMTAEPNNLLQAAENQIGSDQLYIGNGQADNLVFFEFWPHHCFVRDQATRNNLLQGIAKNRIYVFSNLFVPKTLSPTPNCIKQQTALTATSILNNSVDT